MGRDHRGLGDSNKAVLEDLSTVFGKGNWREHIVTRSDSGVMQRGVDDNAFRFNDIVSNQYLGWEVVDKVEFAGDRTQDWLIAFEAGEVDGEDCIFVGSAVAVDSMDVDADRAFNLGVWECVSLELPID